MKPIYKSRANRFGQLCNQITGKVKGIHANVKFAAISPPSNHTTNTVQKDNIDQIAS